MMESLDALKKCIFDGCEKKLRRSWQIAGALFVSCFPLNFLTLKKCVSNDTALIIMGVH